MTQGGRQHGGAAAAHVADAKPDEQVGERPLLRPLDGVQQIAHRKLGEAFEADDVAVGQGVDVADVCDQVLAGEQHHGAFAESLDVHGTA